MVVPGAGPNLLGKGWIKYLGMGWEALHRMQGVKNFTLPEALSRHEELFKEELGELKGPPAKIYVAVPSSPKVFQSPASPLCNEGKS